SRDWSSDVCSSDLDRPVLTTAIRLLPGTRVLVALAVAGEPYDPVVGVVVPNPNAGFGLPIGRVQRGTQGLLIPFSADLPHRLSLTFVFRFTGRGREVSLIQVPGILIQVAGKHGKRLRNRRRNNLSVVTGEVALTVEIVG